MTEILWNHKKLESLKRKYRRAKREEAISFIFEGHELLVSYAKYLIEYLETILNKKED